MFFKNSKTSKSLNDTNNTDIAEDVFHVEKLPFDFKKTIANYKNFVKPEYKNLFKTIIQIVILFIVLIVTFVAYELVSFQNVLANVKNYPLFNLFGNIIFLSFTTIALLVTAVFVAKTTPDMSTNYVNKSKYAGITKILTYFLIISFMILAAGVSV